MSRAASMLAATVLIGTAAASGCGFGPGQSSAGEADLRVTREFGTVPMVDATLEDPTESDTVVRFLDEHADIETSYGDNFVDSIGGFAGSTAGGGDEDWFFFVNGYYSDIGSGEQRVVPGDRIWWDYRYWAAAYRVPAVVGSWPEPFLHGYRGEAPATVVQCMTERDDCETVAGALADEGVEATLEEPSRPREEPDALRVLVGPWAALRSDPAARQIESGPGTSGVYGTFAPCGDDYELTIEDERGRPAERYTDAGLIAAVRDGEDEQTWVVTGTDAPAAGEAAAMLGSGVLQDRYAVAVSDRQVHPVPAADAGSGAEPEGGCR